MPGERNPLDNQIDSEPAALPARRSNLRLYAWLVAGLILWVLIYWWLERAANFITYKKKRRWARCWLS